MHARAHAHTHTHTHTYTQTHTHTYTHTYTNTRTHTHKHVHTHTQLHTFTHTQTHTQLHKHTHTHMQPDDLEMWASQACFVGRGSSTINLTGPKREMDRCVEQAGEKRWKKSSTGHVLSTFVTVRFTVSPFCLCHVYDSHKLLKLLHYGVTTSIPIQRTWTSSRRSYLDILSRRPPRSTCMLHEL
jgi:hypothetical protein